MRTLQRRTRVTYHKTTILQKRCVAQQPEVTARCQSCWRIQLKQYGKSWNVHLARPPHVPNYWDLRGYIRYIVPACKVVQWFPHFQWTSHLEHPRFGNHDTMRADLWGFQLPVHKHIYSINASPQFNRIATLNTKHEKELTLAGSRPTRPHARAATPGQPWEIATIPMESGPGCTH